MKQRMKIGKITIESETNSIKNTTRVVLLFDDGKKASVAVEFADEVVDDPMVVLAHLTTMLQAMERHLEISRGLAPLPKEKRIPSAQDTAKEV